MVLSIREDYERPNKMSETIRILEKPDWITWESVHDLLWEAHQSNREKGIIMKYPSLSGQEIQKRVEGNGKMFVAIQNDRLVGCAAAIIKTSNVWFSGNRFVYLCFVGIHPNNKKLGLYSKLIRAVESYREEIVSDLIVFDTHRGNSRMIRINEKNGYQKVMIKMWGGHESVVLAKWYEKCPFSNVFIKKMYYRSVFRSKKAQLIKLLQKQ